MALYIIKFQGSLKQAYISPYILQVFAENKMQPDTTLVFQWIYCILLYVL